jgi:hypothetical protein
MTEAASYTSIDPSIPGAWGWHRHALPGGWHAYDRALCPMVESWWFPAVTTFGGPQLSPMQTTSYIRWEVADAIRRALRQGLAVEVRDGCPTTTPRQRFAAGPCSPLTCPIGRPMRGCGPRYR